MTEEAAAAGGLDDADAFERFFEGAEPPLRRALVARFGPERGAEAAAEAMRYAWEHWPRVSRLDNPRGYLFRVGRTRTRPRLVPRPATPEFTAPTEPDVDLVEALAALSWRQRVAVVLIHGEGYTSTEVADLLACRPSTVQTHLRRGLENLRRSLS